MGDDCKAFYLEPGKFEGNIGKALKLVSHFMLASHSGAGEETFSSPWCGKGGKQRLKH